MQPMGTDAEPAGPTRSSGKGRNGKIIGAVIGAHLVGTLVARQRGYRFGRNVVVRCRAGHLFTTIWIPGASVKSLRLGWARFQRCPVGKHWSLVTPVKPADLTAEEQRAAAENRDIRIP
jgi:hypothetical protein